MSHQIIIPSVTNPGPHLVANTAPVQVTITWSPSHDLTPDQESAIRHRLEKLQAKWQDKAVFVANGQLDE